MFIPLGNEEDTNVNLTQTLFLKCWCWIQARKSEPPKRNYLGLWDLRGGESPGRHCVSITHMPSHLTLTLCIFSLFTAKDSDSYVMLRSWAMRAEPNALPMPVHGSSVCLLPEFLLDSIPVHLNRYLDKNLLAFRHPVGLI